MKKLSAQEFIKTNNYISRDILSELTMITSFNYVEASNTLTCDVVLNGEIYELHIYEDLESYINLQSGYKQFDLKRELLNKDKQKIIFIPKQFFGFTKDFSNVIKIEYEKDTGYSLNFFRRDKGIFYFDDYMLIDYNLYNKNKKARLYAYAVQRQRRDNIYELQCMYYKLGNSNLILLNIDSIKNINNVLNKTNYLCEVFRTHTETTSKRITDTYGSQLTSPIENNEEQNTSMFEILYNNSKEKSIQYKKENK